jgi:hypothetical protein
MAFRHVELDVSTFSVTTLQVLPGRQGVYRLAVSTRQPAGAPIEEDSQLQATVAALDVQQVSLQSVDIGQAKIGPITVGDLVVSNTDPIRRV